MIVPITIATIVLFLYFYIKKKLNYWQTVGVLCPKPVFFFGNSMPIFLRKMSLSDLSEHFYFKYPSEKVVGIFDFVTPTLIVKDPHLLEKILVKDFNHFTDHSVDNQSGDLFSHTLFQMTGKQWRSVRYKMSPTFTNSKLKLLFEQMLDCSNEMLKVITKNIDCKNYEIKTSLSSYSLDIIANVVFSVQFLENETKQEFIQMCSSIFNTGPLKFFNMFLLLHFPKLANKLGVTFATRRIDNYFRRIINEAIEVRSAGDLQRNDYVQLLLKLKKEGSIGVSAKDIIDDDNAFLNLDRKLLIENVEITDDLLAGQAFQFLTAGLDPVFLTMLYAMYELGRNQDIQDRVRQEIKEIFSIHGCTYESLKKMHYLEQCIQETLRMYPVAPIIFRQCTQTYDYDGLKIEKGLKLIIPVSALHMDPAFHPDPLKFNPDRFASDITQTKFTYLPFGVGSRMCLGFRFAMVVMKLGLAQIINNFKFTLNSKTKEPLDFNKLAFLKITTNKIYFNFSKVN